MAMVPGYSYHNPCGKPNLLIRPNPADFYSPFNSPVLAYTYGLKSSDDKEPKPE